MEEEEEEEEEGRRRRMRSYRERGGGGREQVDDIKNNLKYSTKDELSNLIYKFIEKRKIYQV